MPRAYRGRRGSLLISSHLLRHFTCSSIGNEAHVMTRPINWLTTKRGGKGPHDIGHMATVAVDILE